MTQTLSRLVAAEYTAIVKLKFSRGSRAQYGVVLILQPSVVDEANHTFAFSSWRFLRENLRIFGLASAKELDTADVRLSTGKQPYMFSKRRWEAPLIDMIYGNCDAP